MTSSAKAKALSDREIGDLIHGALKPGEARLVTELAALFKVPQYRVREVAQEHENLDLLVGLGRGGAVWNLPRRKYQVERIT